MGEEADRATRDSGAPTAGDPAVVSVTTVPEAPDDSARIRRYLVTMAIRTTCFILMVVVDGPLRWVFLAGAAFLPYVAVVLANARSPRVQGQVGPVLPRADDIRRLGS